MPKKENDSLNEHASAAPKIIYPTREDLRKLGAVCENQAEAEAQDALLKAAAKYLELKGWTPLVLSVDGIIGLSACQTSCATFELSVRCTGTWRSSGSDEG